MGDTSDQVIQLLEQGRIDLAVARRSAATDSEHYQFEQFGSERLLVVVHAGHPLAQREQLELSELVSGWPWILRAVHRPVTSQSGRALSAGQNPNLSRNP